MSMNAQRDLDRDNLASRLTAFFADHPGCIFDAEVMRENYKKDDPIFSFDDDDQKLLSCVRMIEAAFPELRWACCENTANGWVQTWWWAYVA